jgi:hypothetical protein
VCGVCPLRSRCVRGRGGRTVAVHPQEALIQAARRFQETPGFRAYRARRQVVEHRFARLVQLGVRQARYVGRRKLLFQLLLMAAVANLTLLAGANDDSTTPALWLWIVRWGSLLAVALHRSASEPLRQPTAAFGPSPPLGVTKIAALRLAF